MRKRLLFVIGIVLLFAIGCDDTTEGQSTTHKTVNDFDGVSMTAKEETISPTEITLIFTNNTDKQGIYGDDFLLEKKVDNNWYEVPTVIDEYGFNDIGYELNPSATEEMTIDWEWLYGSLDTGEYRIIKSVLDFRKSGDFDEYYLATLFTID